MPAIGYEARLWGAAARVRVEDSEREVSIEQIEARPH
jgi:hypothetical protein